MECGNTLFMELTLVDDLLLEIVTQFLTCDIMKAFIICVSSRVQVIACCLQRFNHPVYTIALWRMAAPA